MAHILENDELSLVTPSGKQRTATAGSDGGAATLLHYTTLAGLGTSGNIWVVHGG